MPERAEIEAVRPFLVGALREARAAISATPAATRENARALRLVDDALGRLDRVRDARDDDEATPACPECGCERSDWVAHDEATGIDYPDCPNCDTGQAPVSARSPQGEDHEGGSQ